MFSWIFLAIIFLIALYSILVGILSAKKYVWQLSLAKTITTAVSLVLSVILSTVLAKVIAKKLSPMFVEFLSSLDLTPTDPSSGYMLTELLSEIPSAGEAITVIAAMIIAPMMFVLLFTILNLLIGLLKKPLARLFLGRKKAADKKTEFLSNKKFDGASAACGAICNLLVFIAISAPVIGYVGILNSTTPLMDSVVGSAAVEIVESAATNPGTKAIKVLGGDLIFNSLTSGKVNGNKVVLTKEIECASSIGNALYCAKSDNFSKTEAADAIRETAPIFEKTTLIPTIMAEFVSGASNKWSKGEEFCQIEAPQVGEDFESAMNSLYSSLSSSTVSTIREDYYTISNVLALVIEHNALDELSGEGDILHLFKNEELISGIMLEMLNNERLAPSIEDFANAGISIISRTLGVYENADALYNGFISEIRSEYKKVMSSPASDRVKFDNLSTSVNDIYTKYGIELSEGVAECIALSMLDNGSLDDIKSFELFFGATDDSANPIVANGAYNVSMLASGNSKPAVIKIAEKAVLLAKGCDSEESLAISLDDVLSSDSKFFKNLPEKDRLEAENLIASKLFDAKNDDGEFKYTVAAFADATGFANVSIRLTIDRLYISMDNITDNEAEAKALAKVLSSAVDITDKVTATDDNMVDVIKSFGPVLDSFLKCESIGQTGTANLVTAIMQSDKVQSTIGFTVLQSNEVASVINKHATDDHDSYTSLLSTVGQTVDIIKKSSNKENSTESVKELIETITPTSAETLKHLTTPETVKNYGVPEKNAEKISDVFSDIFDQMAVAKENGMTEEQYENEANAINDMLNIAMNIGEAKDNEAIFGKDSVTEITATEYVERVMNSDVISTTVVNAAYDSNNGEIINDPLGLAKDLTDSEKTELVSAIDSNWKNCEQTTENKNLLSSIAAILGVELQFNGDNVIAK